ncbi:exonuclease domain-containing protein [Corynebacterium glyciniphilum]|uniref:exonuclease domain-containing protein n=1 Tax=Corynebacterium glyciniphilum TaxID=1404244 RepID=UPI00264EFE1A|nr:exonuclease domain-containing protein [Corynebacterium glyciniphilum]MDN5684232.1 3'-5' exonuclease [Corynebacterium glyciniphilum]
MSLLRRLWEKRRATGALADFYTVAPPSGSTPLDDLPVLAVDVEATGLDLATDRLLSIGWVPMDGRRIVLSGAREVVISGPQDDGDGVGQSATVHGLTDDMVDAGMPLADALGELLDALRGRVMLAHFSLIEEDFLSAACRSVFGARLVVPALDTYALERRRMERDSVQPRGEDLRLPRIRDRYGLPSYPPHRAVTDALSCAELFLAMTSPANGRSPYSTLRSAQV